MQANNQGTDHHQHTLALASPQASLQAPLSPSLPPEVKNGATSPTHPSTGPPAALGRHCTLRQAGADYSQEQITYDELATHLQDVTLIDVRNRNELEACGQIPGSHCIPVTEIKYACDLAGEKFKERYGFEKPAPEDPLVICCRTGVRSKTACDLLQAKGFKRHRIYRGSFSEWEEKGGAVLKPGQPHEYDFEDSGNEDDDENDEDETQNNSHHSHNDGLSRNA